MDRRGFSDRPDRRFRDYDLRSLFLSTDDELASAVENNKNVKRYSFVHVRNACKEIMNTVIMALIYSTGIAKLCNWIGQKPRKIGDGIKKASRQMVFSLGQTLGEGMADGGIRTMKTKHHELARAATIGTSDLIRNAEEAGNRFGAGLLFSLRNQIIFIGKNMFLVTTPLMIILSFVKYMQRILIEKNDEDMD
jgi:hypothetical protein